MAIVYFLCGLPCAGKTTTAKKLEAKGAARFTLDERMIKKYDYSIFDDEYGPLANQEKDLIWEEAQQVLRAGDDVILDWSLWNRNVRVEWPQKVTVAGYEYKLFYLDVPLEILKKRLAARNTNKPKFAHSAPLEELERFSKIFEPPTRDEGLNLEIISVMSDAGSGVNK